MRGPVTLLVVAAALAVASCGTDEEPRTPASPTAQVGEARPPTSLSQHQYDELLPLYRVMAAGEEVDEAGPAYVRILQRMGRVCRGVDRGDPLLAAQVDGCQEMIATVTSFGASSDCGPLEQCVAITRKFARVAERMRTIGHRSNAVVSEELAPGGCQDVMSTSPAEMRGLEKMGNAFDRAADAMESGDEPAMQSALREMKRALADFEKATGDYRVKLRRFRRVCAPRA